jgi:hypothetical protein
MSTTAGGDSKRRSRSPVMRARDVVPAALSVVLLLGVAGCMGAFGGGPLDGDASPSVSVQAPSSTPAPETEDDDAPVPGPTPSFVGVPEGEEPPEYLDSFRELLAESKRKGLEVPGFASREDLFSCGEYIRAQGVSWDEPQEGWDCLAEHLEDGAELVLVSPTIEGDPIITYYRVGPGIDGLEYFTDASFDKFGGDTWTRTVCKLDPSDVRRSLESCSGEDLR